MAIAQRASPETCSDACHDVEPHVPCPVGFSHLGRADAGAGESVACTLSLGPPAAGCPLALIGRRLTIQRMRLIEFTPTRLAFEIARPLNKNVEVTYKLPAKQFREVQRILDIIFGVQG
jgi:hypothetical protein